MAKNSIEAYGASGKSNVLFFDPDKLKLVTDKTHPLYDERVEMDLDEAFVLNIMHHGVLEPVLIRKNPENGDVEVVEGRQRVRGTREANKRLRKRGELELRVPAIVQKGQDAALMGIMVSANEHRRDDSPLVRAAKMQRMLQRGHSEENLAVFFGVSVQTIRNTVSILEASAAVRQAVEAEKIGVSVAHKLARLPPEEQKEKLAQLVEHAPKGERKKRQARQRILGGSVFRSKGDVSKVRSQLETFEAVHEEHRKIALAVLSWVLGDDKALGTFVDLPEASEERVSAQDAHG